MIIRLPQRTFLPVAESAPAAASVEVEEEASGRVVLAIRAAMAEVVPVVIVFPLVPPYECVWVVDVSPYDEDPPALYPVEETGVVVIGVTAGVPAVVLVTTDDPVTIGWREPPPERTSLLPPVVVGVDGVLEPPLSVDVAVVEVAVLVADSRLTVKVRVLEAMVVEDCAKTVKGYMPSTRLLNVWGEPQP
jgi:hypothetical protein